MQSQEIELKFPVRRLADFQSSLPGLGFALQTPRTFESNTLYDDSTRSLRQRGQLLRLRQYGERWIVTHKRHPENEDPTALFKTRIETETEIGEGATLETIFLQIGLAPVFRYEKYRSEWTYTSEPGSHLVLDETPIGNYAELEGPPAWIERMLPLLHVDRAECLTESYGKLFLRWKEQTGSPANNLTFDEIVNAEIPALTR